MDLSKLIYIGTSGWHYRHWRETFKLVEFEENRHLTMIMDAKRAIAEER